MPSVYKKGIAWFQVAPQVRKFFKRESLETLAASLLSEGQLAPVGALAASPEQESGLLLWGQRRLAAATLAGLETLDTYILTEPITETQVKIIQWTENEQREQLTAYEQCVACCELAALETTWTNKQIAEAMHLDPTVVTKLRTLERCIPEVQKALADNLIGLTDMYVIGRAEPSTQKELLSQKLAGATRDQLEVNRKSRNGNGHASTVKTSRIKCPLAGGTTIVVSSEGEGLSLLGMIEAMQELIKLARRANDESIDVKTFARVCADRAGAG